MRLSFKKVYVIDETIVRQNINLPFWPSEQRTYQRQKLIDGGRREGWICDFLNRGLRLDLKILIRECDYVAWPENPKTQNTNTIKSELTFHEEITFEFPSLALLVRHSANQAEEFRKKIYISKCFSENVDQIWAAQYSDAEDRNRMFFAIGFNRTVTDSDRLVLEEIRKTIILFEGAEIL